VKECERGRRSRNRSCSRDRRGASSWCFRSSTGPIKEADRIKQVVAVNLKRASVKLVSACPHLIGERALAEPKLRGEGGALDTVLLHHVEGGL